MRGEPPKTSPASVLGRFSGHLPGSYQFALIISLVCLLGYPIRQFLRYGFLFYTNGHDESSYLSFDFAVNVRRLGRLSNYLITNLHRLGLNGSAINFMLDSIFLLLAAFLIPRILKFFFPHSKPLDIFIATLTICIFPLLMTELNPFIYWCSLRINSTWPLSYYLVFGERNDPIYLRTPESQISIAAFLMLLSFLLPRKRYLLIIFMTPFLYSFVGIVIAANMVIWLLTNLFRKFFSIPFFLSAILAGTSFMVFSGVTQSLLFGKQNYQGFLLYNHEPLAGLSLLIMTLVYFIILLFHCFIAPLQKKSFEFCTVMVIASWAIYNTQLISGIIAEPQHFEFESNLIIGLLLAITFLAIPANIQKITRKWIYIPFVSVLIYFMYLYNFHNQNNQENEYYMSKLTTLLKNKQFQSLLNTRPDLVAINDVELSTRISGLYLNKGPSLAFGRNHIFLADDKRFHQFQSLRNQLKNLSNFNVQKKMEGAISNLEYGFKTRYQNFFKLYQVRLTTAAVQYEYNPLPTGETNDNDKFEFFLIE